jgi:predicted AlkP superfamily pyrophosphatase or phosphodiesterase
MKPTAMHSRLWILAALIVVSVSALSAQKPVRDLKPTVILVSIDGFRYDYLEKYSPPTLNKLAKDGVRARWMIPSFPTKTFPNHYSIATGLYPEHHGIIENNIWGFGATFSLGKTEEVRNSRWWLGEPIWVTAEKQGRRSASFFFPGTEAEIRGVRPTYWKEYDGSVPNNDRVDAVLSWLDLPKDKRPVFLTLYFSDVDDAGHAFSPDSEETRAAVLRVDANIARLYNGLKKRKINKKVALIIVSDHGMAALDQRNAVLLDSYFNQDLAERILWTGEIVQIFPKPGELEKIMSGLRNIQHAACWRKQDIPLRLHYQASPRIAPVVCSAEEGWLLTNTQRYESLKKRADFGRLHGAHGYDNKYESMRALFIAHGQPFKKHLIAEPFENIQVYNLMCRILGIVPAPNDGDPNILLGLLR